MTNFQFDELLAESKITNGFLKELIELLKPKNVESIEPEPKKVKNARSKENQGTDNRKTK